MAIEVRPYKKKDGTTSWYIYIDGKNVKKSGLVAAGFSPDLTFDQAKARAAQLNAQNKLELRSKERLKIAERMETERLEALAFLPKLDIEEFENSVLAPKFLGTMVWDHKHKLAVKWRAALITMGAVKLDPSEWAEKPFLYYNYFIQQKFSPGYTERIIALMNLYGYFYCRKYKKAFFPLPPLKGKLRIKQVNAYRSKPDRRHKSDPISPAELEAIKSNLKIEQYNWVYISLWFGLRPEEVDALKDPDAEYPYYVEAQDGVDILHVYQTKLQESVDEEERWKLIPVLYPEQEQALKIIRSGKFDRPLPKTLQKYLNKPHADTYSGRKSFTDLMLGLGQRLEDISQWMGHTTLDRTWSDYKRRDKVHFTKPSAKKRKKAA